MSRARLVVDSEIPFIQGVLDRYADVVYLEDDFITPEAVKDADGLIIRTRTRCNASLLEGSKVRMIATATIGMDQIDIPYCTFKGIHVENSPGCNARGVLQWVSAVLARRLHQTGCRPCDCRLGIVGVGHVGSLVKKYAEHWGFQVICCDPPREEKEHLGFIPLEELLRQSDIVTLHVPLDTSTRHMIDERTMSLISPSALFINASRGAVASTSALLDSRSPLALDVWENEPDIDRELLAKAEVATSHVAGYSLQGKANATAMVVDCASRFFGFGLHGWYPEEVEPTRESLLSWDEMCGDICRYCNLEAETERLKANPAEFEHIRNHYSYRPEFF